MGCNYDKTNSEHFVNVQYGAIWCNNWIEQRELICYNTPCSPTTKHPERLAAEPPQLHDV